MTRAGPLQARPDVWIDENLTADSKVRTHETSVVVVAGHGSEVWDLTPTNLGTICAWDAGRLATTTGRERHEEGDEQGCRTLRTPAFWVLPAGH